MKYVKPEFIVEEFLLNNSIAATSCEDDLDKTVEKYTAQNVHCLNSNDTDWVWNSGLSCTHTKITNILYFAEGYNKNYIKAKLYNTTLPTNSSGNMEAGYYIAYSDGQHDCYAQATYDVLKYFTNSY